MKPTMKIASTKHPQGWVLIDMEAFDPKVHQEYVIVHDSLPPADDMDGGLISEPPAPENKPRRGRPRIER